MGKKLLFLVILGVFTLGTVVVSCGGPSKELIAYYEAKVQKQQAEDEYNRLLDLNAQYKDELQQEIQTLKDVKEKHKEIHAKRNEEEEKRGKEITPLLHGKEDPEAGIDWLK
ncbi:MAG: hypothetical protein B6D57_02665 [Candidatus Coatesbacteria bacterium 4484_99]|uniref:Uncharacterized protein n=1 Tax=Candidatus Coatesbacteria bacterium 4484_99 TaxID=1970774 RepID=A0A1W9S1E8_9BACT|nr:MAG: hypothetical protein B6D57_02665 [Candidatus Coatesbacteria bacterium 4484_99]RLC41469.1 MAG: hypothetical protein DRH49_05365 [Candidatus Coatesbacteria bacterium]RLC44084.1 MAG: hypothetical protein DRH44_03475 [Candidatus Coatesbacteria bacterium]